MSDPTATPPVPPNPSQGDDSISHPLQALPDLEPEPRIYMHPQWWVSISYAATSMAGMIVAHFAGASDAVSTLFLTGNLTTHGAASAGMSYVAGSKNKIYSNAANQPTQGGS